MDFTSLGKKSPKHLIRDMRFEAALREISYYTEHSKTKVIQQNTSIEILRLWCQKDGAEQL